MKTTFHQWLYHIFTSPLSYKTPAASRVGILCSNYNLSTRCSGNFGSPVFLLCLSNFRIFIPGMHRKSMEAASHLQDTDNDADNDDQQQQHQDPEGMDQKTSDTLPQKACSSDSSCTSGNTANPLSSSTSTSSNNNSDNSAVCDDTNNTVRSCNTMHSISDNNNIDNTSNDLSTSNNSNRNVELSRGNTGSSSTPSLSSVRDCQSQPISSDQKMQVNDSKESLIGIDRYNAVQTFALPQVQ